MTASMEEINRLLDEHEQEIERNHCSCYTSGSTCCDCGRDGSFRER
jgi:hypothetical protein